MTKGKVDIKKKNVESKVLYAMNIVTFRFLR